MPSRLAGMLARCDRRTAMVLMTLSALWLGSHPWRGIWHDGLLYAVQALHRLYPGNFENDLYFLHGSQDAFTLFSPVYAAAIAMLGLEPATMVLLLAGHVLWIAAAAYLFAAVLRGFHFWLGLAILFTWPADYGPSPAIFRLAEPFLTPRLIAEGLGILALGCFVRQRWGWGALLALLASALHPLIGGAPLLAGLLLRGWGNWRLLAAFLGVGTGLLAAGVAAGLAPFDRLLMNMDAEWLALVAARAPMVSWSAWLAQEWLSRTTLAFSLVLAGAYLARGMVARLFRCAALLGAAGLLASCVGTGFHDNLLLIQVQPWRLLWMTQLCSWLALAWLVAAYWPHSRLLRALLLVLCLAALTRNTVGGAVGLVAGAALCHFAGRPPVPWPAWGGRMTGAALALLVAAWLWEVSWVTRIAAPTLRDPSAAWLAALWGMNALELGAGAACGTTLLILVWHGAGSQGKARHLGAFALAFGSLGLSALFAGFPTHRTYDLSAQGQRAVQAAFLPLIPEDAVVYWQNNAAVSWFQLHRSNYASTTQITGLAFNRGTAIEGRRRMARLDRLGSEDAIVRRNLVQTKLLARTLPPASRDGLLFVCADPLLDFVVLGQALGEGIVARADDVVFGKSYYLYACARLRAGGT